MKNKKPLNKEKLYKKWVENVTSSTDEDIFNVVLN